ncbi:DMT family transporter [Aromatoleum petrolei]|uniref:EamA family transporter n=1 Tax=Aromatoleum petrolei TaxID=76116 RepID=A0ABX1MHG3_9RHOO|nr:DMT family transporter [Aromatoleum petrolei]NMF87213.1 EamA family transporter [Aromatoleum petrolei]QTQ38456.1 EamA domain-containing protein [Aromatoleum petrolei]
MDDRKSLDARATSLMVVLCVIWGLQQVVLKAAAADIAPILQISLRSGIAALLVAVLMRLRGERISLKAWRPGIVVGLLFALEYLMVGEALRHTSASRTVVFLYTAPIFAALGLHWKLPAERLGWVQWSGIALAFAGVATAFLGRDAQVPAASAADMRWGDFLALLGGVAWGATTVVIRVSSLSHTAPAQTLLYQLVGAFVLLLAAAIGLGQDSFNPTAMAWTSLIFQTLVVSFASFLAWFWLLRNYLASRLGVFSFLTPVFGIVLGALLLDEPLEARFLVGALLVLGGIMVVSGHGWLKTMAAGAQSGGAGRASGGAAAVAARRG